jgi:hypothetical protein
VALLRDIIDAEPTSYEEAGKKKEWKDSMIEEYRSIVKNDVWDVVSRPKEKTMVSSKWITRQSIQHMVVSIVQGKVCVTQFLPERRNRL